MVELRLRVNRGVDAWLVVLEFDFLWIQKLSNITLLAESRDEESAQQC